MEREDTHVMPKNDLRDHEADPGCWCKPVKDDELSLYVHNSMDRREEYEEGRKKH